ncbi:MAG: hypothetical protein KDC05_13995 [Bacteroidales bacterium]|nr:hypothetical protein [Bacteroidales bacterium]
MENNYLGFVKKLILYTIILAFLGYFASFVIPSDYQSPALPFLYVFFFSVTLLVHRLIINLTGNQPQKFIRMFMLLTFGKLFFYLMIIVIYAFANRPDAVAFILNFFVLYVLFTVFEVVQSLKFAKYMQQ